MPDIAPQQHLITHPSLRIQQPCRYRIEQNRIYIDIDAIHNDRNLQDISGTLSIELWALRQPYAGGYFEGYALAGTEAGELFGQHFIGPCHYDLAFRDPPAGQWHLCLMVREWTGQGFATRDYINFDIPYQVQWKPAIVESKPENVINVDFCPTEKRAEPVNEEHNPALAPAKADATTQPSELSPKGKTQQQAKAPASQTNRTPNAATAISINDASVKTLAAIKGLSKKVADNIAADRPYDSIEELLKVKGMGKKLLAKIKPFIKI